MKSDTELAADGSAVTTYHVETEANNAAAAMALGQTSVPYVTANQTLEIVEAYTRKSDGTKIPVDVSAIYDQLPPGTTGAPMITDLHVKTIVFPQFAAGDTAVYTARLATNHAIFPGQYWGGDAFLKQVAFDDVEETLTAPADLPLHIENHEVGFDKTRKGGQIIYHWHYSAPATTDAHPDSVHPLAHLPHYFVSTFPDYASLGRAYALAAGPSSAVTPTIKALADKITKGVSGRRAVARALYEWVSVHIRYVAIELGKGSLIPHAADTVLSNGYGDCKDHVALLAALLNAEGIASESVLIDGLSDYELADVATFAGLDHVITYIRDLDIYLDSTDNVAPFGVLPFVEYGKPAVFASETAARLGQVPALPPGLARAATTTVAHLSKDGVLSGTTTSTANGPYAIELRTMALAIQAAGPETAAKRLLPLYGFGTNSTGSFEVSSPTVPTDSYSIRGTFKTDDWSEQAAGTQKFYLPGGMRLLGYSGDGLMGSFFGNPAVNSDEDIPCFSGESSEDISLEAPAGKQFSSVPADTHVQTANIRFDSHWSLSGQTLSVHRSFNSTIDKPLCTAAIRAANAAALKSIGDSYNMEVSFASPKTAGKQTWYSSDISNPPQDPKLAASVLEARTNMQQHHDDAAIAEFSALLAQPDLPISASYPARFDRAMLYARSGRSEEALADLNAALKLTPQDARMLSARGYVNFLRADFAHAVADCNAALAVDPAERFALRIRANVSMETGKYGEAARDYTTELLYRRDPSALMLRAVAYHYLGRESDAAYDVAQAADTGNEQAKALYDSITGAAKAGKYEKSYRTATSGAVDTPSSTDPGTTAPTVANEHKSYYPPLSALLGEMGHSRVAFDITADGKVSGPVIEKSSGFPALDAAALDSVRSWRYNPARRNGKPVPSHISANVVWSQ
jgi:TonB family protein